LTLNETNTPSIKANQNQVMPEPDQSTIQLNLNKNKIVSGNQLTRKQDDQSITNEIFHIIMQMYLYIIAFMILIILISILLQNYEI
jgi:hypothetical protein